MVTARATEQAIVDAALARVRASAAVTASGLQGIYEQGDVPRVATHPLAEVMLSGNAPSYSHSGETYRDMMLTITVKDKVATANISRRRARAAMAAIADEFAFGVFHVEGWRIDRFKLDMAPADGPNLLVGDTGTTSVIARWHFQAVRL